MKIWSNNIEFPPVKLAECFIHQFRVGQITYFVSANVCMNTTSLSYGIKVRCKCVHLIPSETYYYILRCINICTLLPSETYYCFVQIIYFVLWDLVIDFLFDICISNKKCVDTVYAGRGKNCVLIKKDMKSSRRTLACACFSFIFNTWKWKTHLSHPSLTFF